MAYLFSSSLVAAEDRTPKGVRDPIVCAIYKHVTPPE
jgi:hypothetical protein